MTTHRLTTAEADRLRVRALLGDPLEQLPDGQWEWVFRSLLKRVRWSQVVLRCGLTPDDLERHFELVRRRYQARSAAYKALHPSG